MYLRTARSSLTLALMTALLAVGSWAPVQAGTAARGSAPVATPSDVWTVPGPAVLNVTGRGYGHGHGMSQYGAEGAARAGLTFTQINEFYYPGTQWGTTSGQVRVLITADTTDDVIVTARENITVRSLDSQQRWKLPERGARQWRLNTNAGNNKTMVQWRDRGAWRRWKSFSGDGEFSAPGGLSLVTPSGTVTYRGKLRAASPIPGKPARDTVNVLSLENYLKGVVPLEIPASWSPEAVRAQSVAARTYAAYERADPLARHYQICDTTSCQVYGGKTAEHALSNAAIAATSKQVLTVDGEPAFTQFASSNGGWSSAGSMSYLAAQEDPYDGWAGNPNHLWRAAVGDDVIAGVWPSIGRLSEVSVTTRDGNGEWGGRVLTMVLKGDRGKVNITGDQLRQALGLRSTWFTIDVLPRSARRPW